MVFDAPELQWHSAAAVYLESRAQYQGCQSRKSWPMLPVCLDSVLLIAASNQTETGRIVADVCVLLVSLDDHDHHGGGDAERKHGQALVSTGARVFPPEVVQTIATVRTKEVSRALRQPKHRHAPVSRVVRASGVDSTDDEMTELSDTAPISAESVHRVRLF